jgi:hypothetical protein
MTGQGQCLLLSKRQVDNSSRDLCVGVMISVMTAAIYSRDSSLAYSIQVNP